MILTVVPLRYFWKAFVCGPALVALSAAVGTLGCSSSRHSSALPDSTGAIAGQLHGEFVHGFNPFYGSVVYLIPMTAETEDWWIRLSRPRYAIVDPQQDRSIGFADRTTCDPEGRFWISPVQPGDYYLYSPVLWTTAVGDSTYFSGDAWIGTTKVAARETSQVMLSPPRFVFPPGATPTRRFVTQQPDLDLPRFGEYVYVEQLPQPIQRVEPEYPPAARDRGIDGTVLVQVLVGKDGRVKDTKIVKSIPALDKAAVGAVRQWVFKPALTKDEPVAVWVAVPVTFTL